MLAKLAPGTALREGIDRIIKGGKGALIVVGRSEEIERMVSGGFRLDALFTAQRLSELAKMDGAIIVDDAVERIVWANVHLLPDPSISSSETGTRHRTAERTARQSGKPVISVSESMRIVTMYIDNTKHELEDISAVLVRANQALATLERYRTRLDEVAAALSALEIENVVAWRDVLAVLQRAEMVRRIAEEIRRHVAELGTDGRLLELQLNELMHGVERERLLVVRDYQPDRRRKLENVLAELDVIPPEQLLDLATVADALGVGTPDGAFDDPVVPRGYRLLSRVPRLPERTIDRIVGRFTSLPRILAASIEDLDAVEGIGEMRARSISEGLARLSEASLVERYA